MAVTKVGKTTGYNKIEFQGVATDTKPTTYNSLPLGSGSTFLELDTRKFWVYDKNNAGANSGWWFVCLLTIV